MKNQSHKGSHTYTNGIKTILLFDDDIIPEGFYRGDSRKKNVWNKGLTAEISEKVAAMEKKRFESRKYEPLNDEQRKNLSAIMKGKNTWTAGSKRPREVVEKFQETMKNKSEQEIHSIVSKRWESRKKNNTCNSSIIEDNYYNYLLSIYDKDDIIRNYCTDDRYPFECDFYIKSEDLFIELNGTWTHYKEPFNENNEIHINLLEKWRSKNTKYYDSAVKVWTERDPLKLKTLIDNKLNYLVIYPEGNLILSNDNKPRELLENPFKDNQQLSLLKKGKFNDYRNDTLNKVEQSRVESK